MNIDLTQTRLKELLSYDPGTGIFVWRVYRNQIAKVGSRAGHINCHGYRHIIVDRKQYKASRLAWLYMEGYFPEYEVDHKDRVRDNNKWSNLLHKTPQCNSRNRSVRSDNKTGVPGVSWHKRLKKWQASITIAPKIRVHLGSHLDKLAAVNARWEGEKKYDFPNCQTDSPAYLFLKERGLI